VVEISITGSKKYKSPGNNQILAELIEGGDETCFMIHEYVNFIWDEE
jgi:hypothetical protein